ncbi:MAG: fused MFS/spermidine synthase [Elusimicrobia bacterium]|nr:fused MFS/spermidine synthase [Elusimicrobiota bacterium]
MISPSRQIRSLVSLLFFLSGATGLVYEVLWAKRFGLFLGNTAWAQTIVLAAFLGGLALGNAWLGGRVDAVKKPLRLYAWLELGIGAWGLLSPLLLTYVSDWYVGWSRSAEALPAGTGLRFVSAAAILLPPTVLMGGTLPVLARFFISSLDTFRREIARLYAVNSLGAVAGTLLAGFYLIPRHGLELSFVFAGAVNLAIGAVCLLLPGPDAVAAGVAAAGPGGGGSRPGVPGTALLLAAVFLSGWVSLSYEVAWIRLLTLVIESSVYSFTIMLSAFIAGISLGGYAVEKGLFGKVKPLPLFAAAEIGVGLAVMATLPLFGHLPYWFMSLKQALPATPRAFIVYQAVKFLSCFLVTLPPTIILGMTLPLASRAAAGREGEVGGPVGKVFGLNALGNMGGAVCSGLFLLPAVGMGGILEAGIAANLVIGAVLAAFLTDWTRRRKIAVAAACVLLWAGHLAYPVPWRDLALCWGSYRARGTETAGFREFMDSYKENAELLYARDGTTATITVTKDRKYGNVSLRVNGKADASTGKDMRTQVLLAQLPLLLRPAAREALVIGFGSGVTAGSALLHPLKRLDVAEISGEVMEAERFFRGVNNAPLADPRLKLHIEDAAALLRRFDRRYDVIISEPSNPWMAGVGNLFSKEFFGLLRARLARGGVLVQWLHTYELSDDILRLVLRTMLSEFPNVEVWQVGSDLLLAGSAEALDLDLKAAGERAAVPAVRADLARIGIYGLAPLLSLETVSGAELKRLAAEGPLNTDMLPVLEYEAPEAFFIGKGATLLDSCARDVYRGEAAAKQLARYRALRGGLSSNELASLKALHAEMNTGADKLYDEEWRRRYPDRRLALENAVKFALRLPAPALAAPNIRELLSLAPEDPRYLTWAAELEILIYKASPENARPARRAQARRYIRKAIAAGANASALESRASAVFGPEAGVRADRGQAYY